jgi:ATP-binding cassette, subfamily C, bacterial CydC
MTRAAAARQWWAYASPDRRTTVQLVGSAALAIGAAGCAIGLLLTSGWLISRAAEHPPILYLMVAIVAVRAFGLGRAALRYAERLASHDTAFRLLATVRVAVYTDLEAHGPRALRARRVGDLVSRLVADTEAVQDLVLRCWLPRTTAWVVSLSVAGLVAFWLPLAGLLIAAATAVVLTAVPIIVRTLGRAAERSIAPARGDLAAELVEAVNAADELVAFDAAHQALDSCTSASLRLCRAERRSAWVDGMATMLVGGIVAMTVTGCALLAIDASSAGGLSRVLVAVVVLAPLALQEVWNAVPATVASEDRAGAAVARLVSMPGTSSVPTRLPAAGSVLATAPSPRDEAVFGDVPWLRVKGLAAHWHPAETVLHDLDITLAPGTKTLVRGVSGSGKSTLAAVLLRFLDPVDGEVTLNGRPYADLDETTLRRHVGLLEQDTHVFDTTVRENLLVAAAQAGDDRCWRALRDARLADFVASLPRGLDTPVGEAGRSLSGGERQRLGLARLLLAEHDIVVLDEPTEHLDEPTADRLLVDLLDLAPGRTVVLITHAPVDWSRFDQVLDLGADAATASVLPCASIGGDSEVSTAFADEYGAVAVGPADGGR